MHFPEQPQWPEILKHVESHPLRFFVEFLVSEEPFPLPHERIYMNHCWTAHDKTCL